MPKPKKPKKPKKEGGMYRLGSQIGLYVTGQSPTMRPPSSASLQRPGLQDPTDVFQTDIASPVYQSEQIEYENAKKTDAAVRKKAREDMLARINHRRSGSGRPITQLDTGPLTGSGMSAPLLKEFIDLSYRGNTSIAPAGYDIDAPLSDSRVKVYAKKGSNDKDIVVTHRGSVGLDDWMDNASYMFRGKVKGTKTYNLHRDRHKRAVDKYGASNIIAIGHSRAGLYLQELQKEFPIKENITYNKASGFHDIGRQNDTNQTDVRVGNDVVSLLAPLQRRNNAIVNISGTKNPFDFNAAHQTGEINKVGDQFIGKKEGGFTNKQLTKIILDKNKVIGDLEETAYKGGARKRGRPRKEGGFTNKQLTKIILDKNEVIGDLEETAYKKKRGRPRKVGGIIDQATGLQAAPALTNQQVEDMLRQMNPDDVRKIPLNILRDWIRTFRATPTGQNLYNQIYFAGMVGYPPRPLERAFIDDGGIGGGIGSSKTARVSPHDIQVVFPQYPPDRPVQIHPEPAPVPPPPPIPRPPRRPRQNFNSPQRKSKFGGRSAFPLPPLPPPPYGEPEPPPPPLPPLTERQITDMIIGEMNPQDVYRIIPHMLRNYIRENRVTPRGEDLALLINFSRIRNYVPPPLGRRVGRGRGRPRKVGGMVNEPYSDDEDIEGFVDYPTFKTINSIPALKKWLSEEQQWLREEMKITKVNLHDVKRIRASKPPMDVFHVLDDLLNHYLKMSVELAKPGANAEQVYFKFLPKTHSLLVQAQNRGVPELNHFTNPPKVPNTATDASTSNIVGLVIPPPPAPDLMDTDDMLAEFEGSGTLPVISSVEGIKRLIATEQARLRKIKKGYKYKSPTMSQDKIEEKIARLKERLKSAKANKGHADVSYFIPKSIKWLKIMADETRVGSDAYNKELLEAVKKLLAELSGKKPTAANKKKTAILEEDQAELERLLEKDAEKPKSSARVGRIPRKKGYSKKTPDDNKPAPVIIPPSSLTNERANIRAAVERGRTYNKIIDDKQQEDFKVILKAMVPDPPAQRTKEDDRKERAREAARRQRERDKPSGFTQAQEYNKATKQRQTKAKEYGIPTREYTASLKREAQLKKIEEGLEDEDKKKAIREERNKLKARYTYLDEIMNSDNTDANRANTASMGEQPVVVEAEVELPIAPLAGSGMCGGSLGYSGKDPKFVISGKNEEYKLLY